MMIFKKQDVPISEISRYFGLSIDDASRELGICVTLLKKICRKNGIPRWPRRKLNYIERRLADYASVGGQEGTDEIAKLQAARSEVLCEPNGRSSAPRYAGRLAPPPQYIVQVPQSIPMRSDVPYVSRYPRASTSAQWSGIRYGSIVQQQAVLAPQPPALRHSVAIIGSGPVHLDHLIRKFVEFRSVVNAQLMTQ